MQDLQMFVMLLLAYYNTLPKFWRYNKASHRELGKPYWCLPRISNRTNSPGLALLYRQNFGRVQLLILIDYWDTNWYWLHSQYGYFIWKWKFHSEVAARGFPFSDRIWCNAFQTRSKLDLFSLRMEMPFRFILNFSECSLCSSLNAYLSFLLDR